MLSLNSRALIALSAGFVAAGSEAAVIADWTFTGSGGAGTVVTSSAGGYTATLVGSGIQLTANGAVTNNSGYLLTNLPITAIAPSPAAPFTIEVLATFATTTGWQALVGSSNDADFYFGNNVNTSRVFSTGLDFGGSGTTSRSISATTTFGAGMHNFALSEWADGTRLAQYVDGVESGYLSPYYVKDAKANASVFEFGNRNAAGGVQFNGTILRVRISDHEVPRSQYITVPEPTSLLVLALGLVSLAGRRRA